MAVATRTGRVTASRCPDAAYSHMDSMHIEIAVARFHVGIWGGLQGSRRRVAVSITQIGNISANIEIDSHKISEMNVW